MAFKFALVLVAYIIASVLGDDYAEDAVYKQEHCIKITPEKEEQLKAFVLDIGEFLTGLTMKYEDIDIRYVRIDIESHSEDEVEEKDMVLKVNINDCHKEGKPPNPVPNIEAQNNGNGQSDANSNSNINEQSHNGIDIEIADESNDVRNDNPSENHTDQEQNQVASNVVDFNEITNVDNNNTQNPEYTIDVQNYTNVDTQNLVQSQAMSVRNANQTIKGQVDETNNHSTEAVCNCENDDAKTAVSVQRPTVTFLELPENGQELIKFFEGRKKKKVEPVWMYMLEEDGQKEYVVFQ